MVLELLPVAPAPVAPIGPAGGNALSVPANNPYNLFGVTIGVGSPPGAPSVRMRLIEFGKRAVLLKIHRETLAATFEPIMEAVSQAGGDLVHVLTEEKQ